MLIYPRLTLVVKYELRWGMKPLCFLFWSEELGTEKMKPVKIIQLNQAR